MDDTARAALFSELDFERLAGTPDETRAMEILLRVLRGFGVQAAVEEFPVHTFRTGTARLECGAGHWDLHPYGLQGNCVVEGELRFVDNPEVLAFNTDAIAAATPERKLAAFKDYLSVNDLPIPAGDDALLRKLLAAAIHSLPRDPLGALAQPAKFPRVRTQLPGIGKSRACS